MKKVILALIFIFFIISNIYSQKKVYEFPIEGDREIVLKIKAFEDISDWINNDKINLDTFF